MATPGELRARAERYRRTARSINDRRTVDALYELAAEYEQQADAMERKDSIRSDGAGQEAEDDDC